MKIVIALISNFKDKNLKILLDEQIKRANKFAKVEFIEFKNTQKLQDIKQKYKNYFIFALAEKGKNFTTLEFAEKIQNICNYQNTNILFCISDADGFLPEDVKNADEILSLSKLTFTHEMATFILTEQIYRILSVINNGKYHRE